MKVILVATDGSASAERAVEFAAGMAASFDATLHIVNVLGEFGRASGALECRASGATARSFDARMSAGSEIVRAAKARAEALSAPRIETETCTGPVVQSILEIAREEGADAIVVGKRGRGRISGLILGSVSQKIVCEAFCPVVVVP